MTCEMKSSLEPNSSWHKHETAVKQTRGRRAGRGNGGRALVSAEQWSEGRAGSRRPCTHSNSSV